MYDTETLGRAPVGRHAVPAHVIQSSEYRAGQPYSPHTPVCELQSEELGLLMHYHYYLISKCHRSFKPNLQTYVLNAEDSGSLPGVLHLRTAFGSEPLAMMI